MNLLVEKTHYEVALVVCLESTYGANVRWWGGFSQKHFKREILNCCCTWIWATQRVFRYSRDIEVQDLFLVHIKVFLLKYEILDLCSSERFSFFIVNSLNRTSKYKIEKKSKWRKFQKRKRWDRRRQKKLMAACTILMIAEAFSLKMWNRISGKEIALFCKCF